MCPRCPAITVDADKGVRHTEAEPLKTLKTFRSTLDPREQNVHKNAPFFGINLGIDEFGGIINVEDDVYVIKKEEKAFLWPYLILFPLPILLSNLFQ